MLYLLYILLCTTLYHVHALYTQDFFYPEGVAYKVKEGSTLQYAVLEIHYDNEKKLSST